MLIKEFFCFTSHTLVLLVKMNQSGVSNFVNMQYFIISDCITVIDELFFFFEYHWWVWQNMTTTLFVAISSSNRIRFWYKCERHVYIRILVIRNIFQVKISLILYSKYENEIKLILLFVQTFWMCLINQDLSSLLKH